MGRCLGDLVGVVFGQDSDQLPRMPATLSKVCSGCGTNKASAWRGTGDGPFWCKLADCMREGGYLPPLLSGRKRHRTAGAEEGEGEEHQEEGSIADAIAPIYQIERVLGQR